jgi:tetratricopeptide (TPR) repeat protein
MNNRPIDDSHIEELLRRTTEQPAPAWLKQEIMQRVNMREPWLQERVASRLFQRLTFGVSPASLVVTIFIGCMAFWGGIQFERYSTDMASQNAVTLTAFSDTARENYLTGRELLAGDRRQVALSFFQKAVELEPDNPEYLHWQGVAYWSVGNKKLERQSYIQTVQDHPDFVPSLLNLGHSYLESGDYSSALQYYQRVLQNDEQSPQAIYNSALAYQRLNDESREKQMLKHYLNFYRTGKWAYRAVEHLQQLGDFTFRSYRVGIHYIILNVPALLQTGSTVQKKEVALLADALNRAVRQELEIIVYNKEKKDQARDTALNLRGQLLRQLESENNAPIMVSWFDAAETLLSENGDNIQLSPSILIFSNPLNKANRRKSI